MKIGGTFLLCLSIATTTTHSGSLPSAIAHDCIDTFKTGAPIAVGSALLWHFWYALYYQWPNVTEPTASFIRATWKEQGFEKADTATLKAIPHDSFMAKVVVYTQELPGGLAVGAPFIKRVERLLTQQQESNNALQKATEPLEQALLQERLLQIEDELNECRFVCGHERVHQERYHAYKMLLIQCCTPFLVYMTTKHSARLLTSHNVLPVVADCIQWKTMRFAAETALFLLAAHIYEQQADLHASKDPAVMQAGIRLFKRALQQKVPEMGPVGYRVKLLSWVIKYTHPVLQERIWYLTLALKKAGYNSDVCNETF